MATVAAASTRSFGTVPVVLTTLGLINSAIFYLVFVPFFSCAFARHRMVSGSRPRAALNAVVVNLRPFIRPAVVAFTAFSLISDQVTLHGVLRMLNLLGDLALCSYGWQAATTWVDEDEDDPWAHRGDRVRRALTAVLPATASATS